MSCADYAQLIETLCKDFLTTEDVVPTLHIAYQTKYCRDAGDVDLKHDGGG